MGNVKRQTILIVDDEPVNLSVLNGILSESYKVRAANSGERALKVAVTDPRPDLILLDIMMPEMDGYSVLAKLKRDPLTRDIPVIFFTAMEADENEEDGFVLGAVDYITKPIRPGILLARVKTQLMLKQSRDFLHNKNAYLEAEISRRMEENQVIQNASIRALAHLAEIRDTDTGAHILRTQAYVHFLTGLLQDHPRFSSVITEHFIELMAKSAPLHDLGKVGIPDHILLKPGKLTDDEWVVMKTHTVLGARAIEQAEKDVGQPIEFLGLAKEIAHWHHERWDGSGYPDGLVGDDIPLSARLMAVADVFDAIIMPRVYKKPMSFEKAREVIAAGSNHQFDPDIINIFLEHFGRFEVIARQHLPTIGA